MHAVEIPFVLDYGGRVGQSKMKVAKTIRTTLALLGRRFAERFGRHSRRTIGAKIASAERAAAIRDGRAAEGRARGDAR